MSNNTRFDQPPVFINNDIIMTELRPTKTIYEGVTDNNAYRLNLQRNGDAIRKQTLSDLDKKMMWNGTCERQQTGVVPFKKGSWW